MTYQKLTPIIATGATEPRYLGDRAADVVNVKDYGAKGDGVSDDTVFVQAALSAGRNVVFFPAGTYKWSGNGPTIKSNTTLVGDNAIIVQSNADEDATISTGEEFCGFRVDSGSENICIGGFEFRGPFYGSTVTPRYRSIGVHISGRYDQYFYDNSAYPSQPSVTPSDLSKNITIKNCTFNGWGQSAILADNIDRFVACHNNIYHCGRDGIRMYGCKDFSVTDNYVNDMAPGFSAEGIAPNNNVYGISATRIYNSATEDGVTTVYRPSSNGIISRNIVNNCPSWKALDTHGGTDIIFSDNMIFNAHIGIGVDKGGYNSVDGYAPPRRLTISGNHITADPANTAGNRAGIAVFAHDFTSENCGQDIFINNNYINGFGEQTRDGGIVVSNCKRVALLNNNVYGSLRSGINLQNTVLDFTVSGGSISNIIKTSGNFCAGVAVQSSTQRGVVDYVTFIKDDNSGDTMTAISCAAPDSGYGVVVGNQKLVGSVTISNSNGVYTSKDSCYYLKPLYWANVKNDGTFRAVRGGLTVAKVSDSVGRYVITVPTAFANSTNFSAIVSAVGDSCYATVYHVSDSSFEVRTFDSGGELKDCGFSLSVHGY